MPRIYECQKCQKQFSKKCNLISHLNRKFSCDNLKTLIYTIDNNKPNLKPIAEEVAEEVAELVAEKIAEKLADIKENVIEKEYEDYLAEIQAHEIAEIAEYITKSVGDEVLIPYSEKILEEFEINEIENNDIINLGEFFEANQYLRAKANRTNTSKYRNKPKKGRNNRF